MRSGKSYVGWNLPQQIGHLTSFPRGKSHGQGAVGRK